MFFVKKLFRQRKQIGSIAPKQRRGWQRSRLSEEMRERLIAFHQEKNDYTLSELAALMERDFSVRLLTRDLVVMDNYSVHKTRRVLSEFEKEQTSRLSFCRRIHRI